MSKQAWYTTEVPAARRRRRLLGLAVSLLVVGCLAMGMLARDKSSLEGNPFRGRELFDQKRCTACHAVWGHGGTLGPEISVAVAGKTFYELVGDFWNHTPQMIDEVSRLGNAWPTLDPSDMADLLSYLYYLRLFDQPGSAERGAEVYARLQCGSCHPLGGRGGSSASPLDRFSAFPSPTQLAQAMWNAGPLMRQEQLRRGITIPQLSGSDMADLQAHIRNEGQRRGREIILQPLPNPALGAAVYRAKGCGTCHDGARPIAPDLSRSLLSRTASEIIGLLWNHSYAMSARMESMGVPFPRFTGNEMSDLLAHLYFLGYVGQEGNPRAGATLFDSKGCVGCHRAGTGVAPNLEEVVQRTDRAGLASAIWNHAPQMHRIMADRAAFWPKFEPGEMRDLVAYLRTKVVKR